MIDYSWRGPFTNPELNALQAEGFGHRLLDDDWQAQVSRHSLGWVCAREDSQLVGFVNVAWDGGVHAFLLDTLATARVRRGGVGARLVAVASDGAREGGCEWLHVDFEDHLRSFYFGSCGFNPTNAGLIALRHASPDEATTINLRRYPRDSNQPAELRKRQVTRTLAEIPWLPGPGGRARDWGDQMELMAPPSTGIIAPVM